jgi:hypothetical protein
MAELDNMMPEFNYGDIFASYGKFFRKAIVKRHWGFLIYNHDNSFYIPSLVTQFFQSFNSDNIDQNNRRIYFQWGEDIREFNLNVIENVTGIQGAVGSHPPVEPGVYLAAMGENCEQPEKGGIKGTTMYKNVYANCRWVCTNVLGLTNTSNFYETSLHITYALMTQDFNFSMQHQLFDSICAIKAKFDRNPSIKIPLSCLITQICRYFMTMDEFSAYDHLQIRAPVEQETRGYTHANPRNWTKHVQEAQVHSAEIRRLNDADFWNQEVDEDEMHFRQLTWEALRRLHIDQQGQSSAGQSSRTPPRRQRARRGH